MLADLRFAFRRLLKAPSFALTSIAVLALGIGANSSVFTVVNSLLLHPAGIRNPERVVSIRVNYKNIGLMDIDTSAPDFRDVRDSRQIFEHTALADLSDVSYVASGAPQRLVAATVSHEWFDCFGATPIKGRLFRPEEDQPNANRVVILAYGTWQHQFGGDPDIVNKTVELNRMPYKVVGVMGPSFDWPKTAELWTPIGLDPQELTPGYRFNEHLTTVALLRPGVSVAQANAYAKILSDHVRSDPSRLGAYAKASDWGMAAVPMVNVVTRDVRTPVLVLLASCAFVLLIACSNLAGLALARSSSRTREAAIRAAIGATRGDLIRDTLAEALIVGVAGGLLGLNLTTLGVRALLLLAPESVAASVNVSPDWHVLAFTALVTIGSAILFGIPAALQSSRVDPNGAMKEGGRGGTTSRLRQRMRSTLVVAEIALAVVLLIGAGLFLRNLSRLETVNPGFDSKGVLTASISLPMEQYGKQEQRQAFYHAVVERLSGSAGVADAAVGLGIPFAAGQGSGSFSIEGRPQGPGDPGPHGNTRYVSAGYFRALKIPVMSGRAFTAEDRAGSQPVVVIDQNLAGQYWPGENPVGKRMRRGASEPWRVVVGVVGHVLDSDLASSNPKGTYYMPIEQDAPPMASLVVRTGGEPLAMADAMRQAVAAVDPALPLYGIRTLDGLVGGSLAPRKFLVTVLGFFAAVALLMAALGLYGLMSYSVTQRTHEMGIRVALGAGSGDVLRIIVGEGARLALFGIAAGAVGTFILHRILASRVSDLQHFDWIAAVVTMGALVVTALLASYLPARRVLKVDPIQSLRYE